jgi:hypothetical protein
MTTDDKKPKPVNQNVSTQDLDIGKPVLGVKKTERSSDPKKK